MDGRQPLLPFPAALLLWISPSEITTVKKHPTMLHDMKHIEESSGSSGSDTELVQIYLNQAAGSTERMAARVRDLYLSHFWSARASRDKSGRLSHADAQDALGDFLTKAMVGPSPLLRRLKSPTGGALNRYIRTAARNAVIDLLQKKSRMIPTDFHTQSPDVEDPIGHESGGEICSSDRGTMLEWVRQALDRLNPLEKEAILWELRTSGEPESPVPKPDNYSVNRHRAIKKLARLLRPKIGQSFSA